MQAAELHRATGVRAQLHKGAGRRREPSADPERVSSQQGSTNYCGTARFMLPCVGPILGLITFSSRDHVTKQSNTASSPFPFTISLFILPNLSTLVEETRSVLAIGPCMLWQVSRVVA